MLAVPAEIPEKPSNAASKAMTRNINVHRSIIMDFDYYCRLSPYKIKNHASFLRKCSRYPFGKKRVNEAPWSGSPSAAIKPL